MIPGQRNLRFPHLCVVVRDDGNGFENTLVSAWSTLRSAEIEAERLNNLNSSHCEYRVHMTRLRERLTAEQDEQLRKLGPT